MFLGVTVGGKVHKLGSSRVSTTVGMVSDVIRFKNLCRSYEIACSFYHCYGAGDSEPDGVLQEAIWNSWNGKPHDLKPCGKYWQLFTASYDAETLDMVAARLVDNALPIVHFLQSAKRTPALEKAVFDYCWRFAR